MNAERLLELYDRVAEAPDAVPRLRRFVLDLAVRGKLVEQDPGDEPASKLLRRISDEKGRLEKEGLIKQQKTVRKAKPNESIVSCPKGWAAAPLTDVAVCLDYMRQPINGAERSKRIEGKSVDRLYPYYGATQQQGWIDSYLFDEELVLLGEDGVPFFDPFRRKAYVVSGKTWVNNHAHVFKPILVSSVFLANYLNVFDYSGRVVGATRSKLNQGRALDIPILLPPLEEQHRIVEKVDELMALCDRLEEARTTREATRDRLTTASLARLTAPDTDEQSFRSHARFALDAFPALTTCAHQIKALRQTILNLAVRGKLVKQDPADGSVKDAGRLVEQYSEELPNHWACVQLKHLLVEGTRNGYSRKPDDDPNGVPILRISAGTAREDGFVVEEEHKLISGVDHALRREYSLRAGDLLACRFNGNKFFVGRFAIFKNYLGIDPIYPDKLIRIRVDRGKVIPDYLRLAGDSDLVRAALEEFCATTVGNWGISATKLKEVVFPVPPTAEQKRIVARVYELMALCDRLTQRQTAADGARRRLLESLLRDVWSDEGVRRRSDEGVRSFNATGASSNCIRLEIVGSTSWPGR